jgi:hypothetical protein
MGHPTNKAFERGIQTRITLRPDARPACPITASVWASGLKVLFGELAELIGNESGQAQHD